MARQERREYPDYRQHAADQGQPLGRCHVRVTAASGAAGRCRREYIERLAPVALNNFFRSCAPQFCLDAPELRHAIVESERDDGPFEPAITLAIYSKWAPSEKSDADGEYHLHGRRIDCRCS